MLPQVYISVGANMGDKLENCRNGIAAVADHPEMTLVSQANFYKTAPMDFKDQDWFVNTAIGITTTLLPKALLIELQAIQSKIGRKKSAIRFGPRILDLDIIFYGDQTLKSESLTIPHPRMHLRRFVLQPLCDLVPDFVHPIFNKELKRLLNELDPGEQPVEEMDV